LDGGRHQESLSEKSGSAGASMIKRTAVTASLVSLLVIPAHAEGDAARGEAHFKECAACHKLAAGANEVGPSLHGVFSRKAGELADFRYSPAMKRSGVSWTPEALDKYLADPQAFIPANRMPYAGMSNAADRADLIAYLQKATQ
jgi:cytochrome c2